MAKVKTSNKTSLSNKRAKSTKVGLKETEGNKVLFSSKINILYFDLLQFCRQKWSVAPSIFNIKEQGLAHCVTLVK